MTSTKKFIQRLSQRAVNTMYAILRTLSTDSCGFVISGVADLSGMCSCSDPAR